MEQICNKREACITEILKIINIKQYTPRIVPMTVKNKKIIDRISKKYKTNVNNIAEIMQFNYLYATVLEAVTKQFKYHFGTGSKKSYNKALDKFYTITGMSINSYAYDIYIKVCKYDDLETRIAVMNQFIKKYIALK